MTKDYKFYDKHASLCSIKGKDIFQAIENNFKYIADRNNIGDAGGYKLTSATLLPPNKNSTSGGKHFATLVIRASGQCIKPAPEKITECWIYCDLNEFSDIKEFDIKPN